MRSVRSLCHLRGCVLLVKRGLACTAAPGPPAYTAQELPVQHDLVCGAAPGLPAADTAEDCRGVTRPASRLRQVAMLLVYRGENYYGMACIRDEQYATVERRLFSALQLSGAVEPPRRPRRFPRLTPPCYSRASRTDRGVSALGQVVSLRMRVWDGVVEAINRHLPADVRVCDVRRVPPSFNAQTMCDARLYSYTLPTMAFAPITERVTPAYRLPDQQHQAVSGMFQQYVGVHSFHSFTRQGVADRPQMLRCILSVELDPPYLAEGLEFVTIWIRGRSFVLHQIRRMVGTVVAECRAGPPDLVQRALQNQQRLITVTAPSLGLVLRQAQYDTLATANWNRHGALAWRPEAAAVVRSHQEALLQHIHSCEAAHSVTFQFLSRLLHTRFGAPVINITNSYRTAIGYAAAQVSKLAAEADTAEEAEAGAAEETEAGAAEEAEAGAAEDAEAGEAEEAEAAAAEETEEGAAEEAEVGGPEFTEEDVAEDAVEPTDGEVFVRKMTEENSPSRIAEAETGTGGVQFSGNTCYRPIGQVVHSPSGGYYTKEDSRREQKS